TSLAGTTARHSEYTEALLGQLGKPWRSLDEMHALVSAQVAAGTKLAQVPVYRADPAVLGQAVNLAVDDPATRYAREAQKTAPAGRDTIQMDAAR
ncbi:hypothetical protein ABTA37_19640, partial [Acinetobacter baumannii]